MAKRTVQPGRAEAAADALAGFTWSEFGCAWAELLAFLEGKTFSREEADAGINLHLQHGRLKVVHPPDLLMGMTVEHATLLQPTPLWSAWAATEELTSGPLLLGHRFAYGGKTVKLQSQHHELMKYLWSHKRSKVDDVIEAVWGGRMIADDTPRKTCHKLSLVLVKAGIPIQVHCKGGEVWWEDTGHPGR
jgi:hypothetical protein